MYAKKQKIVIILVNQPIKFLKYIYIERVGAIANIAFKHKILVDIAQHKRIYQLSKF